MSFEAHLEEQIAFGAACILSARGHLEPSSEGERAQLAALRWNSVPVLCSTANAETPKTSFIAVTTRAPQPMAEDESSWSCEVGLLLRTLAWDDAGKPADPLKVANVHRRRGVALQKLMSPLGDRTRLTDLANGEGDPDRDSRLEFKTKIHGFDFIDAISSNIGDYRAFDLVYLVSYSWNG